MYAWLLYHHHLSWLFIPGSRSVTFWFLNELTRYTCKTGNFSVNYHIIWILIPSAVRFLTAVLCFVLFLSRTPGEPTFHIVLTLLSNPLGGLGIFLKDLAFKSWLLGRTAFGVCFLLFFSLAFKKNCLMSTLLIILRAVHKGLLWKRLFYFKHVVFVVSHVSYKDFLCFFSLYST